MSISDVTSRIQEIQAQIAQLAGPSSTSVGGTSFANALTLASTDTTGTATPGTTTGTDVIDDARKYLGVPYVWGGTDPKKGLDCSGLTQLVYKDLGYSLPRVAADQAKSGTEVPGGLVNAQPGDLLTFGSPAHHVAIYIGNGQMIEAPHPGANVRVAPVVETPSHVRRILNDPSLFTGAVTQPSAARVSGAAPYADLFANAARTYNVPASLLEAVAKQESGFNPSAVSPAGAQGLMQLMPGTAKGLGVTNSFDPAQSINGAARMLRDLTRRFGSTDLALAAYNAGPGAVLKYNGIPPYPETQNYVRNVLSTMKAAS